MSQKLKSAPETKIYSEWGLN